MLAREPEAASLAAIIRLMPRSLVRLCVSTLACTLAASLAQAQAPLVPVEQITRDILRELVEIPSTESGVGSTPAAHAIEKRLLAAGFARGDVQVVGPNPRKMNLVARLRGRGAGRPILLLSHLDVVEARAEDWSPDLPPFRFVERDGYYYGRGTQDIKDGAAILTANLIRWRQEGWVPARDLVLALTADEEGGPDNGVEWLLRNRREPRRRGVRPQHRQRRLPVEGRRPVPGRRRRGGEEGDGVAARDHEPRWPRVAAAP